MVLSLGCTNKDRMVFMGQWYKHTSCARKILAIFSEVLTIPKSVSGGDRPNPGNHNERRHQPQHPANSREGPLSRSWSCHQYKNNVEVLAREEGWFKCKVGEAIKIKTIQLTINQDQGFDLSAIYSEFLPFTRDRDRQTSGHSALSSV